MIYSQRRKSGGQSKHRVARLLVVGLGSIVLVGGALVALDMTDTVPLGIRRRDTELVLLWNESRYRQVREVSEAILQEQPLDGEALTFGGFAHFYLGIEVVERSEQLEHLDRSIVLLRKALHVPRAPLAAERDYVLAKAYYHKGEEYLDLSIRYMTRSLERGHDAPDSRTYLALAFGRVGDYRSSVEWFERAIERAGPGEADAVRIKAAESYVELEEYAAARRLLSTAISNLEDDFLRLMARNQLASVLILDERLDEAEALLQETVEQYPESADAYYYLGIVYEQTGRGVKARDFWRTARDIDPNHTEALQRLANWGG